MAQLPCVISKSDGRILARAAHPDQVIPLEGNWYFHPDAVTHELLEVSDRTYHCPYKGTCLWIDLKRDGNYVNDIAWVYPSTLPGYRKIAGWYGFYPDHPSYAKAECG